jgi:hypothetical protein
MEAIGPSEARRVAHDTLERKVELCSGALTEARRLAAARMFGPTLSQLLARACDLLDDMDEVLIGLHPGRDHEAFVRATALHRRLEEIQSLMPREYRRLQRGS